jgi:hypothetical protein
MEQELRVRVLGGTELTLGARQSVELASAKATATALLVYLAVTGAAPSRSALAGLLWSDLPEQAARANLRLVLTKLRRALPEQLEVTREKAALAPTRPVRVDALEVARQAGADGADEELLEAVRLCRGVPPGLGGPRRPLFEEWVLARRATDRTAMLALMDRAIQRARDRADPATGIEVARRPPGAHVVPGRGPELARLHELLDDPACRLVTLVGPGGIGKTCLAWRSRRRGEAATATAACSCRSSLPCLPGRRRPPT